MKITITIIILETSKHYDISVDTNQRIITTLQVMHENMVDFPEIETIRDIRYGEGKRRILMESTYEQAHIFSGDILCLSISDEADESNEIPQEDGNGIVDFRGVCKETYKKSDFSAKDAFDFAGLIQRKAGLIDCTYMEDEEDVTFVYDMFEMTAIKNIQKESMQAKYNLLINMPTLLDVLDKYDISLTDENIYYDRNYVPNAKKRDLNLDNGMNKVQIYKAFIGAVLGKKHGIDDYLNGGTEVIEKEKWFVHYKDLNNVFDIRKMLIRDLDRYNEKQVKTRKEVSKIGNWVKNIMLLVLSILAITMTSLFVYYGTIIYPLHIDLLNGEKAFLRKEYVTCIDALEEVDVEKMDYETKYILAVSYAKTENLNRDEITNIVDELSLTSGERELEYWVYLGRKDFFQAEDAAKFLMDDRLLAYAYMKEYNQLESENQITGEEKEQRMNELKSLIEALGKKYTPEE